MARLLALRRAAVRAAHRLYPGARPVRVVVTLAGGGRFRARIPRRLWLRVLGPPPPEDSPGEAADGTLPQIQVDMLKALRDAGRPIKARALANALGLQLSGYFRANLRGLRNAGRLKRLDGGLYCLPDGSDSPAQ